MSVCMPIGPLCRTSTPVTSSRTSVIDAALQFFISCASMNDIERGAFARDALPGNEEISTAFILVVSDVVEVWAARPKEKSPRLESKIALFMDI